MAERLRREGGAAGGNGRLMHRTERVSMERATGLTGAHRDRRLARE